MTFFVMQSLHFLLPLLLILLAVRLSFSLLVWLLLGGYLAFRWTVLWKVWRAQRHWWEDFRRDLRQGVAEQKSARVYDRFRAWSVPATCVVWAQGDNEGFDLHVDPAESKHLRVGDVISVDYLPRSQLVIAVSKLS